MKSLDQSINDLVIANRVLAHEQVVDAYGHISIRHPTRPDRFLLSRSRSPELVEPADIMEFTLDGQVVGDDKRPPYLERFIHAGIYEKRPDVMSVVHSHAEGVLPFAITEKPLSSRHSFRVGDRPHHSGVGHCRKIRRHQSTGHQCGARPRPRREIRSEHRGADAWPRIRSGRTIATANAADVGRPAKERAGLSRGDAAWSGKALSEGEIENRLTVMGTHETPATLRAWEYWACRCGCGHLLPGGGPSK